MKPPPYKSSIPAAARERVVERYPDGTKAKAEYRLNGKLVGLRDFFRSGEPEFDYGMKAGERHGTSEVLYWKNGLPHGFEWWLEEDQSGVFIERHWHEGRLHGVERQWNGECRLSRGYPRYHVCDKIVTKRQYLKASASDPALPPFRLEDNGPARTRKEWLRTDASQGLNEQTV